MQLLLSLLFGGGSSSSSSLCNTKIVNNIQKQQRQRQFHHRHHHHLLLIYIIILLSIFSRKVTYAMSSAGAKRGALIFLHGLGDSPAGWSQLEYMLPELKPRLKDIVYVFPPAPTIPITINGGMRMPGWFDLYDWPIDVGSKDDKKGLLEGIESIQKEVTKLNQQGITSDKIVLGGFSQGGAVALLATYYKTTQTKFAGCAGLSAWLTLPNEITNNNISEEAKLTPLFWGHGRMDDKVLFPQQKFGIMKLSEAGVQSIKDESYPMGHSSHPDEMESLANFVDSTIFGDDGGDNNSNKDTNSEEL